MKFSSFLASVTLHVYVFLTLAPLPESMAEMIRCLWCSAIWGMVKLFFWARSTCRKSWQREKGTHTEIAGISNTTGFMGQTRF